MKTSGIGQPESRMTVRFRQRLLKTVGLGNPGHPFLVCAHRVRRAILQSDQHLRDEYLCKAAKPKLHIGGGWRLLDGWLNTDIELIPKVMRMDATEPFPFAENTFQYVYNEHMIEHVPHQKGARMLQECYRVMRGGGVIRVVTPNLAAIIGLYGGELCPEQQEYLLWFCRTFVQDGPPDAVSAINAMLRQWGHQFLYDEKTLTESMCAAGFKSVQRCVLGESPHHELQNMENEQRYPKGLLNFESVALEAVKVPA
jgi:predicted SAM-dependent methyltransferase